MSGCARAVVLMNSQTPVVASVRLAKDQASLSQKAEEVSFSCLPAFTTSSGSADPGQAVKSKKVEIIGGLEDIVSAPGIAYDFARAILN